MQNLETIKQIVRDNMKISSRHHTSGGQTTGFIDPGVILYSEELDLKIEIGQYKSRLKNQQFAVILFELALDEFVK